MTATRHNGTCTVLIATGDPVLSRKWSLALQEDCTVFTVAGRTELARGLVTHQPSILFLDRNLPGLGGVDSLPTLQRLHRATKILLFSAAPTDQEGLAAIKAGARGYFPKNSPPHLLRKAVALVQADQLWIGRTLVAHLLDELALLNADRKQDGLHYSPSAFESLTAREREVVSLVGNGACNKEIANQLQISLSTTKGHLTSIFKKLGISDRLHLALLATSFNGQKHTESTRSIPAQLPAIGTARTVRM